MKKTIGGIEFDFAFTVEAQKKIEEKFGGMDKNHIEKIFDTTNRGEFFDNMLFMAETLINAANHREYIRRQMLGEPTRPQRPIRKEELEVVVAPGEVPELERCIIEAIKDGNKVKVEIEPQKGKNTEATQSE